MMFIMPVFAGGSSESGSELVVSTWGLSEDDLWAEVYEPFETENDATVILDVGNGQERFTKLQNDPRSTVDVLSLLSLMLHRQKPQVSSIRSSQRKSMISRTLFLLHRKS